MQRITTNPYELCVCLVTAIVEQLAEAAAPSNGVHRFDMEARLLRQLMQDLPQHIATAEEAAKMIPEEDSAGA